MSGRASKVFLRDRMPYEREQREEKWLIDEVLRFLFDEHVAGREVDLSQFPTGYIWLWECRAVEFRQRLNYELQRRRRERMRMRRDNEK